MNTYNRVCAHYSLCMPNGIRNILCRMPSAYRSIYSARTVVEISHSEGSRSSPQGGAPKELGP